MKLLFFDIETTGFSRQYDYIIELAGIIYNTDTKETEAVFHEYIKPKKRVPIHITEITGITNVMVANKREEKEVLKDFLIFIEEHKPEYYVGHNLDAFDLLWIKEKTQFFELVFPEKPTIDTLKVARKKKVRTSKVTPKGNPSYTQESIAAAYGISYDAHSAIADVKALIEIFERMEAHDEAESKQISIDKRRVKLGF